MSEKLQLAFGTTAQSLSRNPLGIIALFIVLVYGLACLVVVATASMPPMERLPLIYFLAVFPVLVLGVFTYLVAFRSGQLFAPSDFKQEETYLELQKMRFAAVASLAISKQTKGKDRSSDVSLEFEDVVQSVETAMARVQRGAGNARVLWVDDNPRNNIFERRALEAVGVKVLETTTTADALKIIGKQSFGAIISDMGRQEGPREGYVLLDALRKKGDQTPLFFFASSNAPEHKRETQEHGGQGCTNDGKELFDMVIDAIFGSKLNSRDMKKVRRDFLA